MNEEAKSPLRKFEPFVRMVFRHENDGRELGDEPYIPFICAGVEKAREEGARSVINMPPRHLKTFHLHGLTFGLALGLESLGKNSNLHLQLSTRG